MTTPTTQREADERTTALIAAAEERATAYDGDDREGIKNDVINAFYAGSEWERRRARAAIDQSTRQAAPEEPALPTNDEVYSEVRRQRGSLPGYVSTNAVNDVMAAVRLLLAAPVAAPEAPKTGDKHSKLPWRITDSERKIVGADGATVANLTTLDLPNAELIVASVNRAAPDAPASEQEASYVVEAMPDQGARRVFDDPHGRVAALYPTATTASASPPAYGAHTEAAGEVIRQAGFMDQAEVLCEAARRATNKYWSRIVEAKDAMIVELAGHAFAPKQSAPLDELFAAIDEAQRMNRYNESSFQLGVRVARLKCLADDLRAALARAPLPAQDDEPPSAKQEKLRALADRIDREKLWKRPMMYRDSLADAGRDRLDAGIALRRYAELLAPGRWIVLPPTGPVRFSASTLDKAYEMAKRDQDCAAMSHPNTTGVSE